MQPCIVEAVTDRVLGVTALAKPAEIRTAYLQRAKELHPDANPDNPKAEERFKEVSAAYAVLGDETKRKALCASMSMPLISVVFFVFDPVVRPLEFLKSKL